MIYQYLFLIFLPISTVAECDYGNVISNVKDNDYTRAFAFFSGLKDRDARYWYFYGCLCHKQFINNILSDDVEEYFNNTLSAYKNVFTFNGSKYIHYTKENLVSIYNLYMRRGVAYLKMDLHREARECFQHACVLFPTNRPARIKMLYTSMLEGMSVDAAAIHDIEYEYLLLYVYISQNKYAEALSKIRSLLLNNKYDFFAWLCLYQLREVIDIKKLYRDKFYDAMMYYFNNDFTKAYSIMHLLSVDDINYQKIYYKVLYEYCHMLQNGKNNKKLFSKVAHECIASCKSIFYDNHSETDILRTMYYIYMSLGDVNAADDIIKYHKIKI
ncbi:MAG: hypothetical protein II393_04385 [Cytophagales bacterium]|nr:hypothetical protein [Cytophagales bacterium]